MKFGKRIEELKSKNQDRIMLARCGAFIIAIGEDAIFLSQIFGFKLTCFKSGVCKIGIPITYILKYLKMIEDKGYSYIVYDYNKDTKAIVEKWKFNGINEIKITNHMECKECQYYIDHYGFDNMNIFDFLQNKQEGKKDEQQK